MEEFPTLKG